MHIATVHKVICHLSGSAARCGVDSLCETAHLAVHKFDVFHSRRVHYDNGIGAVTVEHNIFCVEFGGPACKREHQALHRRLLACLGGIAIEIDITNHICIFLGGIGVEGSDVVCIVGIVKHQFDGARLVVQGCKQCGCAGDDGRSAVDIRTGVRSHAATLSGLAEEKGEAIFATGLEAVNRLGCRGDVISGKCNLGFGGIALLQHHGFDQNGSKVGLVVSLVPTEGDGVLGAGGNHRIQRTADGRGGESLLQIGPVRCLQVRIDPAHTGIEGLVHSETVDGVGNLVGLYCVHIHERSGVRRAHFVGVVGLLIDLKFVTLGVLDLLPGKDYIRTGGGNDLGAELGGSEHSGVVDLVEHFGALLASSKQKRASEYTKYVFKYLFHTRFY